MTSRAAILRTVEGGLFGLASLCLGGYLLAQGESALFGALQNRRLERTLTEGPGLPGPSEFKPTRAAPVPSALTPAIRVLSEPLPSRPRAKAALPADVIGRLEAPRLGLKVIVAEGVTARTLRLAVGHVPGTALPGEPGNVALAGHRDTVFRRLRDVEAGDTLRLTTPGGVYEYVVDAAEVVEPARADLLEPTPDPTLTLVTCYPFYLVGPAPQRFVVRARQVAP